VNNLHRSQHQLAHQDDSKGGNTTNTTETGDGVKILTKKARKEVIKKKKTTFLNFFYERWLRFLDSYMGFIEKKFPGAMQVYRVFVVGFKVNTHTPIVSYFLIKICILNKVIKAWSVF